MERERFLDPRDPALAEESDPLADFLADVRATFVVAPDEALAGRHLAAMSGAFQALDPSPTKGKNMLQRAFAKRAAKAFAIGVAALMATGSALATTGNLPTAVQDAVANTVDPIVDLPGGDDAAPDQVAGDQEGADENGQEGADAQAPDDGTVIPEPGTTEDHGPVRSTEGCTEGFTDNHGQFVSSSGEQPRNEVAQSDCGKPEQAVADHGQPAADGNQGDQGAAGAEHSQGSEHSGDHPNGSTNSHRP